MTITAATRCRAAAAVLITAITFGTAGCGQSAPSAGAKPTTLAGATGAAAPTTDATTPTADAAPTTEPPAAGVTPTAEPSVAPSAAPDSGLSVNPATGSVPGPEIARTTSDGLAKNVGRPPQSLTCPDLPATVGAAITCRLTDSGASYDVTVTTSKVEGSDVYFDYRVADHAS